MGLRRPHRIYVLIACGALMVLLAGCGQKGPLYHPPDQEQSK